MSKEYFKDPIALAKEYQKRIMIKHEGHHINTEEITLSEFHIGFAKALISKDYYSLSKKYEILNGLNHCAVEMFTLVSGINIKNKTKQKSELILAEWCGYSQNVIQKNDLIMNYVKNEQKLLKLFNSEQQAVLESIKYIAHQFDNGYTVDKIRLDGSKNKKLILYKEIEGQVSYIDFSKKNMSCYQDVLISMGNALKYGALTTKQIIDGKLELIGPDIKDRVNKDSFVEMGI